MNESPAELLATIAALRSQLEETNGRLAVLERVVRIHTGEDGRVRAHIECHTLAMRSGDSDTRRLGFYMGVHQEKPFLHMFAPGMEEEVRVFKLETDPQGECRVILKGRDDRTKALLKVHKGAGLFAAYTPADTAGVTIQGHEGGGSVAVLDPKTGVPRALLIHNTPPAELAAGGSGHTELVFQDEPTHVTVRLRAEKENRVLVLAPIDSAASVICAVNGEMASMTAQCSAEGGGVAASVVAMPDTGRIFISSGVQGAHAAEAGLELIQRQAGMIIKYPNGENAIEASITGDMAAISLRSQEAKGVFEVITHHGKVNSCTFCHGDGTPFHQLLSNAESSSERVSALHDAELGLMTLTDALVFSTTLHRGPRPLLGLGFNEQGGALTVSGSGEGDGGAILCGGKYGGTLVLSNADGQAQVALDSTDYGGRLNINNDLGFTRISMGVYEESAGIHLNHTGRNGVTAVATPGGGVVMVYDGEGSLRETLPEEGA